jgi:hypothetical protein
LDFLIGMNASYTIGVPTPGVALQGPSHATFDHDPRGFIGVSTAAFALVEGDLIATFVPISEVDGATLLRTFAYVQQQDAGGAPTGSAIDTWPDMGAPAYAIDLDEVTRLEIR